MHKSDDDYDHSFDKFSMVVEMFHPQTSFGVLTNIAQSFAIE